MKHLTAHSNQSGDDQMNFTPLWTAALNAFSNFIIVDERCRIAYMNKPYTEILNIKLEDVIGNPSKALFRPQSFLKSWLPAKLTSVH